MTFVLDIISKGYEFALWREKYGWKACCANSACNLFQVFSDYFFFIQILSHDTISLLIVPVLFLLSVLIYGPGRNVLQNLKKYPQLAPNMNME